jgi:hypothetical protein
VGSFALAGALEGLGKGLTKAGEMKHSDAQMERQATLQEARDSKLAKIRNDYAVTAATTLSDRNREDDSTKYMRDMAGNILDQTQAETTARNLASTQATSKEIEVETDNAKSYQKHGFDMELQRLKNEGTSANARITAGKTQKPRWNYAAVDGGAAADWSQVTQVRDTDGVLAFNLMGENVVRVGMGEDWEPSKESLKRLPLIRKTYLTGATNNAGEHVSGETITDQFLREYNYLPAYVFEADYMKTPGR